MFTHEIKKSVPFPAKKIGHELQGEKGYLNLNNEAKGQVLQSK